MIDKSTLNRYYLSIRSFVKYHFQNKPLEINRQSGRNTIFFLLTPNYGNLGDQAITYATKLILEQEFPQYEIVYVSLNDIYTYMKSIEKSIRQNDIVVLQGGGNMGSLYPSVEVARQFVIKKLKKNRIVSFPTSIKYTDDAFGKRLKMKSQKIYENHNNLALYIRDGKSFSIAKMLYPKTEILLYPDIVLSLKLMEPSNVKRENVLICLRRDKETAFSDSVRKTIIERVFDEYPNSCIVDTMVFRDIPDDMRDIEIKSICNEFYNAKLMITDRLHGMILSTVTHTPCVVLNSSDGKVESAYKWIENINYIEYIKNPTPEVIIAATKRVMEINKKSSLDYLYPAFKEMCKNMI